MVLSTETFNQSVRTEYSKAVNARYTFQPLWVSGLIQSVEFCWMLGAVYREIIKYVQLHCMQQTKEMCVLCAAMYANLRKIS